MIHEGVLVEFSHVRAVACSNTLTDRKAFSPFTHRLYAFLQAHLVAMSDAISYLKSLVAQLNEKIEKLEKSNTGSQKPFDAARELRMILVGPPGAGASFSSLCVSR